MTTKVQGRADARHRHRGVVVLVGVALLALLGVIALLATELAPGGQEVTAILAAASFAGVIGILAWSGGRSPQPRP